MKRTKETIGWGQIPAGEAALFCTQAGLLLKAGIPLGEGLASLIDAGTPEGRAILQRVADRVAESGSLYEGVRAAGVFPPYMVQMIRVGEAVGKLENVLDALSAYYEREDKLRRSVRSAVMYPVILVLLMAAVVAVLVVAVLPVFSRVLQGLGSEAIGTDSEMVTAGIATGRVVLVVVGVLLVLMVAALIMAATRGGRALLLRMGAHLPFLRGLARKVSSGRFASVMAMMLSSGYHLDEALELSEDIVSDGTVKEKIRACREKVNGGAAFSEALLQLDLFSGLYARMIQTGEKAGRLDDVMEKLAAAYETEVDDALSSLVSAIEPTLVVILSIVIGSILLSVMLPLISILSVIG